MLSLSIVGFTEPCDFFLKSSNFYSYQFQQFISIFQFYVMVCLSSCLLHLLVSLCLSNWSQLVPLFFLPCSYLFFVSLITLSRVYTFMCLFVLVGLSSSQFSVIRPRSHVLPCFQSQVCLWLLNMSIPSSKHRSAFRFSFSPDVTFCLNFMRQTKHKVECMSKYKAKDLKAKLKVDDFYLIPTLNTQNIHLSLQLRLQVLYMIYSMILTPPDITAVLVFLKKIVSHIFMYLCNKPSYFPGPLLYQSLLKDIWFPQTFHQIYKLSVIRFF